MHYYQNYINNEEYIIYDEKSGITVEQLKQLNSFVTNDTNKITDIIFDFDRTFTMVEGIYRDNTLLETAQYLNTKKENDNINVNNFLDLIMGGNARRLAMKQLLETCLTQNINIKILTNNDLPNLVPTLMPNVINLILDSTVLNSTTINSNIAIISTRSKERNPTNKDLPKTKATKFKKLNDLKICKAADPKTLAEVKRNLKKAVPFLVIQEV